MTGEGREAYRREASSEERREAEVLFAAAAALPMAPLLATYDMTLAMIQILNAAARDLYNGRAVPRQLRSAITALAQASGQAEPVER